MATLYITPFSGADDVNGLAVPRNAGATQAVTISGTSAQSAVLPAATRFVEVTTDAACYVALGANPTASSANGRTLWPSTYLIMGIPDGVSSVLCKVAGKTL